MQCSSLFKKDTDITGKSLYETISSFLPIKICMVILTFEAGNRTDGFLDSST